jgi:hypothetical protein
VRLTRFTSETRISPARMDQLPVLIFSRSRLYKDEVHTSTASKTILSRPPSSAASKFQTHISVRKLGFKPNTHHSHSTCPATRLPATLAVDSGRKLPRRCITPLSSAAGSPTSHPRTTRLVRERTCGLFLRAPQPRRHEPLQLTHTDITIAFYGGNSSGNNNSRLG